MKIKVCGMTRATDLQVLADEQVDFAGIIFYERSPRFAGNKLDARAVRDISTIRKVGVFVDAPEALVLRTVADYGLDMVQLHGSETPACCETIRKTVPVVKAFRIGENVNWEQTMIAYIPVTDYFLFDTASAKGYGGTGERFNWLLLTTYPFQHPYFLSGGISEEDAEEITALHLPGLFAVDINSRFETSPGIKDLQQVSRFVKQIHSSLSF